MTRLDIRRAVRGGVAAALVASTGGLVGTVAGATGSVSRRVVDSIAPQVVDSIVPLVVDSVASPVPPALDGAPYSAVAGRRATVHFAPGDSLVAARVRDLLDAQPRLPGLPDSIPAGVHAVLAHTPEAFDEITGGVVPEWRAGVAIPMLGLLVMPTGEGGRVVEGEGLRTLRHEWAHLGLQQHLGDLRAPRWFNEGYAQWASGGFETSEAWRLRVLIATGRAPSMDSLELRWPAGREEARTAYLLAATAVTYLLEEGGEVGLALFLDRWKAERSFESAFRETFGLTTSQFEEDWRKHVRQRYGWLFVLSHSAVFWLLLALVLLFMVRGRRGRNREKLARLRARELPDAPAFWRVPVEPGGDAASPATTPTAAHHPGESGGDAPRVPPKDPEHGSPV